MPSTISVVLHMTTQWLQGCQPPLSRQFLCRLGRRGETLGFMNFCGQGDHYKVPPFDHMNYVYLLDEF
jgi:hypothetical protein